MYNYQRGDVDMAQKINAELVKNLRAELKKARTPQKKEFSKREALEELKPVIVELREKGFDFEQIAELITQKSKDTLKASSKDLSTLFRVKGENLSRLNKIDAQPKSDTPAHIEEL